MFHQFGGPGFGIRNVNRTFEKQFRCYSVALAPTLQRTDEIEFGGKIFLPPSALEELAQLNITYPMLFNVSNDRASRSSHCGILEFNAKEGQAHLPHWLMQHLLLKEGDLVTIKSATLPLGRFVKIQPQSLDFLEISNPRAVLENALRRFSCMTVEDVICIQYNNKVFELRVLETRPGNAISIVETDVEVDFAPPPGYVEPTRTPNPQVLATSPNQQLIAQAAAAMEDTTNSAFVAFKGQGQRISGRNISASVPIATTSISPTNGNMLSAASKSPGAISSFSPKNAAPLHLPKGKLVFGSPSTNGMPPPAPTKASGVPQQTTSGFVPFSGAGNSLK